MKIKIKNSGEVKGLYFDERSEFDSFYDQIILALKDETNSKMAIYETEETDQIFPSLYLKNSFILLSTESDDDTIESQTN